MQLAEERFAFDDLVVEVVRPCDPAALIDVERFEADEYMPYWAEVWAAGLELARHCAGLPLEGRSVLELGCGVGLPSLVAALRGARVTATDWAPEALETLEGNAARNGVPVETVVVDWRDPAPLAGRRFELVLAADVLYEERNAAPLLATLGAALAGDGEALLADPGRRHAARFPELAAAEGFRVEELDHGLRDAGRLLRLTRR